MVLQPPCRRTHGKVLRCCDQPALFSRELGRSKLVHVPVEAEELGIGSSGALGSSGEHLEGKDINRSVAVLVRQASGMGDDVGESCAGKVRPNGSAKFRQRSAK